VLRATVVLKRTVITLAALMFAGQAWAFPMKPDVKALIQEAKRPPLHFVPARAGWNGPEENVGAPAVNATYEDLRREPTPEQKRAQLIAAAVPDWRVCAGILLCIAMLRALKGKRADSRLARPATVLEFPASAMAKSAEISEAA
jgi:hypothetical protein